MLSAATVIPVIGAAPGIFAGSSGTGQVAALNDDDNKLNGPDNPAKRGSVVTFFATGEGLTNPAGIDGMVAGTTLRRPAQPVVVRIGGQQAEVLYAGSSPGFVSGTLQVNARVPAAIAPSTQAPLELQIGDQISRPGVTLAVR